MSINGRKETLWGKWPFQISFWKKIVCLSVCLTFFESADARDLGQMTLFFFSFQSFWGTPELNLRFCVTVWIVFCSFSHVCRKFYFQWFDIRKAVLINIFLWKFNSINAVKALLSKKYPVLWAPGVPHYVLWAVASKGGWLWRLKVKPPQWFWN